MACREKGRQWLKQAGGRHILVNSRYCRWTVCRNEEMEDK